jgi:uncharacterized membrane protein YfcA
MKTKTHMVGLGISMFLSFLLLGMSFYGGNSPQGVFLMFVMIFPGLSGLYFSTKIQNSRIKWTFIIINYFLSTYYILENFYNYLR